MGTGWFATREDVRSALGSASSARDDAQIDRAIESASRDAESLCQRDFQPVLDTRYFDWPSEQTPRSWRLWLDRNELISAILIQSAGVEIPDTDYYLEPTNSGPPYNRVETRLDRPSAWDSGDTHQHAASILGWYGHSDVQTPAGTLAVGVDATATEVTVADPTAVGVGDLLSAGAERMTVTGRALASTGQTLQAPLGAQKNDVLVQVADVTAFHPGEVLTLGAERMRVRDITDALLVERAYDGTQLDSHTSETIWAPRRLTVTRGAAGTTATSHSDAAALSRWVAPGLLRTLTIADAICTLLSEQAGYARTVRAQAGTSGTRSVAAVTVERDSLRQQVADSDLCRKIRIRAV
ncbi:hypothetical protein [Actinacidiphila sp. ITFR-21]|uniref:hypothetical protein n=1 Tax=Actinacidiphila sp. ITFR-21 TaxID=3075199 RepID=UPI00288B00AE|nr:hypothetical protein [Streptomyces sp. ITFR-21]WNI19169.1 hypothetical protein RLT57_28940 [Streptomyces sp. ITFR-21]